MKKISLCLLMLLSSFVFVKAASVTPPYCSMSVCRNIVSVVASNVTDTIDMAMALHWIMCLSH